MNKIVKQLKFFILSAIPFLGFAQKVKIEPVNISKVIINDQF